MRKIFLVLPLLASCAAPAVQSATTPGPAAVTASRMQPAIHWTRNSAEHTAIFLQTYRLAGDQLRNMVRMMENEGRIARWAVILDADETVLDNSIYQKRRADMDSAYSEPTWNAWVAERAAPALPGAAEFTRTVKELGGLVVIVTNRDESGCPATRENLAAVGIGPDLVLCRPAGPSDKNPRFRAVEKGTASSSIPAHTVVMWVGDNIQDFPAMSQSVRDSSQKSFSEFGRRLILLPNPMYGSWERNAYK